MSSPSPDPFSHESPAQKAVRQKLGMAFFGLLPNLPPFRKPSDPRVDKAVNAYREVVEEAAALGVEAATAWHTLGTWTRDGWQRVEHFTRALKCMEQEKEQGLANEKTASSLRQEAECLYEIGRVHFHLGTPGDARDFLLRALPLAQDADRLADDPDPRSTMLEGSIAELLLKLPDEED